MIDNYILIIGAMKSGTTTLFQLLAEHPRIAPCTPKEPGFFAFEDRWAEGFDWYEGLFDFDPDRHLYALDGSTDYSKHPFCTGVAGRLLESAPRRFKLIYILRHPLRRIESHARHVQRTRKEVGQSLSPRRDHGLEAGVSPVSRAISCYADQLDQYAAWLDAGDLLILSFEDLVRDQAGTLERVLEFLSLEPIPVEAVHRNSGDRTRRRATPFWRFLTGLGPASRLARAVLPKSLRDRLRRTFSEEIRVEGRFRLTQEEEAALLSDLAPDIARLAGTYGVDTRGLWGIEARESDHVPATAGSR